MRLVWTRPALANMRSIAEYIAERDLRASRKVIDRIGASTALLSEFPDLGRPGRAPGTRELFVSRTRYLVIYRVLEHDVLILAVFHERQSRPTSFGVG